MKLIPETGEVEDRLGTKMQKEGPEEALKETPKTQICLYFLQSSSISENNTVKCVNTNVQLSSVRFSSAQDSSVSSVQFYI